MMAIRISRSAVVSRPGLMRKLAPGRLFSVLADISLPRLEAAAAEDQELGDSADTDHQEQSPGHGGSSTHVVPFETKAIQVHGHSHAGPSGTAVGTHHDVGFVKQLQVA